MPVEGLEKVTPEVAANVGKRMAFVNSFGVNVWLRFAHEMNGDWYAWGEKPQLFLQKWKLITDEVRKQAPGTYMLWAPNSAFGENHDSIHGGYNPYWPGGDMVDMIGLSFYHYGGFYRKNILPGPSEAFDTIKTFASLFGTKSHDRPMVLAETSAAYTHSLKTGEPAPGGASEKSIKLDWLKQLVSPKLSAEVPELKAFVWFEILKNENASGVSKVKSEDFRLVSGPDKSLKDEALAILKGTKINKAKHYSGKKKGKKNSRQRGCRRCKKKFFRPIKNLKHPH
ncbi:glycoside hydrolase superfamily [Phakopsora pachyrhizi]|uniref:Glycoside hydrolase superfamily n=1 Tax=Phakopsora pachyrhizi TaxID=170000 RepID=A0AAV0AZX3_PHAPC|nr:glycoside hydrolase superfamily [Phakopsora pachyrhizi]CAH7675238.1 glycoside hydrolase superfamily [Phakopsora pachyrhizi]